MNTRKLCLLGIGLLMLSSCTKSDEVGKIRTQVVKDWSDLEITEIRVGEIDSITSYEILDEYLHLKELEYLEHHNDSIQPTHRNLHRLRELEKNYKSGRPISIVFKSRRTDHGIPKVIIDTLGFVYYEKTGDYKFSQYVRENLGQ